MSYAYAEVNVGGKLTPEQVIELVNAIYEDMPDSTELVTNKNPSPLQCGVAMDGSLKLCGGDRPYGRFEAIEAILSNGGYHYTIKIGKDMEVEPEIHWSVGDQEHIVKCIEFDEPVLTYSQIQTMAGRALSVLPKAGTLSVEEVQTALKGFASQLMIPNVPALDIDEESRRLIVNLVEDI